MKKTQKNQIFEPSRGSLSLLMYRLICLSITPKLRAKWQNRINQWKGFLYSATEFPDNSCWKGQSYIRGGPLIIQGGSGPWSHGPIFYFENFFGGTKIFGLLLGPFFNFYNGAYGDFKPGWIFYSILFLGPIFFSFGSLGPIFFFAKWMINDPPLSCCYILTSEILPC